VDDAIEIERAGPSAKERLYRQIVETGLEGIWIVAPSGETLFANRRMAEIFGCAVADMVGHPSFDFVFPEDEALARERYRLARCRVSSDPDFRFRRKDGQEIWVLATGARLEDEDGQFIGVLAKIIDVSRRKQAERALEQSEREYQALLENLPVGVYRTTPAGAVLYANRTLIKMLGYADFGEVSARDLEREFIAGYSRAEFKRQLEVCDEIKGFEAVWKTRAGEALYVREHARCIRHADGRVKYYEGAVEDVTDKRRAEVLLKESEMRYRVFVEQSTEAIWRFETERPIPATLPEDEQIEWIYRYGYLAECNTVMAEMYGFDSAQEILGARLLDMLTPEDPANLDYLRAFIRAGYRLNRMETHEVDRYGERKHFVNSLIGIVEDGCLVRAWGMQRDATEQKRLEQEREQLNTLLERRVRERTAELERANAELESFTYSVSHDLRAPLRFATGLLDQLEKRAGAQLDATSLGYLEASLDTISEAGDLIEELLAFSKLAHAEMVREVVDMTALVRETMRDCQPEAEGREVAWRLSDLPVVSGDGAMLRLVVRNLISNALKYTRPCERAEIEVTAWEGAGEYVFAFKDNGVGFDSKDGESLFKPFHRLHTAAEFEGTGIGLAHVRRIIERHGGRVWADGRKGEGACFYLSLPKAIDNPPM
jgi:PAS domain S-box-containing protein